MFDELPLRMFQHRLAVKLLFGVLSPQHVLHNANLIAYGMIVIKFQVLDHLPVEDGISRAEDQESRQGIKGHKPNSNRHAP